MVGRAAETSELAWKAAHLASGSGTVVSSLFWTVFLSVQWGWAGLLSNTLSGSRIQREQVPSPGLYNCLHRRKSIFCQESAAGSFTSCWEVCAEVLGV